jgi:hypothetical protein
MSIGESSVLNKRIRNHRTIIRLGYLAFALAGLSRLFLRPNFLHLSENASDGIMGFLYGMAIALLLMGVWQQGRARRLNDRGQC